MSNPLVSHLTLTTTKATVNGNVATWMVDWDEIFHGKTGLCKVYCKMRSNQTTNALSGTLNASFHSNHSINTNGVVLGQITKKYIDDTYYYYTVNTIAKHAPLINIPTGKQLFNITIG